MRGKDMRCEGLAWWICGAQGQNGTRTLAPSIWRARTSPKLCICKNRRWCMRGAWAAFFAPEVVSDRAEWACVVQLGLAW